MSKHKIIIFVFSVLALSACTKKADVGDMPGTKKDKPPIVDVGVAQLAWQDNDISMAHANINQTVTKVGVLTNAGNGPSKAINLNWMNSEPTIWIDPTTDKCSGISLKPAESCQVIFTFKPTTEAKVHRTIQIFGQIATSLTVWGNTNPEDPGSVDFSLNPNVLDFGDILIGSDITQTVQINNTGTLKLINGTVSYSGPAAFTLTNNCTDSIEVTNNCSLDIKYSPSTAGTDVGTITVKYSGKTKTLTLTARSLAPTAGNPTANNLLPDRPMKIVL